MNHENVIPSNRATLVGVIAPDAHAVGDVSTGWVKAADFFYFLAAIYAGALGSSATIDAKIEQATDNTGTGAKDVTGKAITQIDTDSRQALINVGGEDLDFNNGFDYIRVTITVGTATSDVFASLQGFDARYAPGEHVSSVAEVVA